MSGNSLISIIMPAYNAGSYISEAIQSILNQSYPEFELIIINDGSKDHTEEIIQSFAEPRIRFYSQENKGVSAARNVGLQYMKGNYFCFLDADDVLPASSLENRLTEFQQDEEISFVDGQVEYFNADFSQKTKIWLPDFEGNPLEDLLSLTGKCFLGNTWMIKRKPGISYQFREGLTHGEDLLFYINLARTGGEYGYTSETVLHYRTGHQSAMQNLLGLEEGYRQIYSELKSMHDITSQMKLTYLNKAKSIVMKSYLGNLQPFAALKSLLSSW